MATTTEMITRLSADELNEFRALSAAESSAWNDLTAAPAPLVTSETERTWLSLAKKRLAFLQQRDLEDVWVSLRDGGVYPAEA